MSSTKKCVFLKEIGIITGGAFIGAIIVFCLYNYVAGFFLDDLPNYYKWIIAITFFVFGLFDGYFILWRVKRLNKKQ
ncbi:MAG: hypothetical protein LBB62_02575 [Proteiniphilum sp.]|jgi:pilus assembly protein TadC|nr:hypothetical protein [Proteiniphilum sp.]